MKIKRTKKHILKILIIAVCIAVVSLIGGQTYAATKVIGTAKATESVKLRKKPTTKSKVKATIKKGKKVDILKKNVATNNGYTWYKVKYENKTGYVASKYLKSTKKSTSTKTSSNKVNSKKPMVALTFDDGPNGTVTPKILDVLEKYGVVATFFDLGSCMQNYPKVSQRAERIGCEVESHTYAHSNLATLSVKQLQSDMSKAEKVYKKTLGHSPKLVRPPYGSVNARVKSTINYPLINWDIDTLDWKSRNKNSIMKEIRKFKDYDGRVILMHGIYTSTLDAVKILIPELQKKGYQFVTVSDMAKYKGVKLKAGKLYCNFR